MPFLWWLYLLIICISSLEKGILKALDHFSQVLLRCKRYVTSCKFKAYNVLIWYTYMLKNDYTYSIRLSPFFVRLFFFVLNCKSSVYILSFNPLWVNIFSNSVSCLLSLLTICCVETFLVWCSLSCLFLILLLALLNVIFKKSLPKPVLRRFPPYVSFYYFIISGLLFKS